MTVYIELVFLENFLWDTLLLVLSARLKSRRRLPRILLGGALGGLYAVGACYVPLLRTAAAKLIFGAGISAAAFGFRKGMLNACLRLLLLSMLFGGLGFFLIYCSGSGLTSGKGFAVLRVGASAVLLGLALLNLFRRTLPPTGPPIEVQAVLLNAELSFSAEYDSGLLIRDLRGRGVMMIDRAYVEAHLPAAVFAKLACSPDLKTEQFSVQTASGSVTLTGIMPQKLTYTCKNRTFRAECYLLLADHLDFHGAPAIYGSGIAAEAEDSP